MSDFVDEPSESVSGTSSGDDDDALPSLSSHHAWQTDLDDLLQDLAVEMMYYYPVLGGNMSPLVVAWSASLLPELIWRLLGSS